MKRNVKLSKIGTSMIAGVMIANNIPAIVSAEENTENAIISDASTDNYQEIGGGVIPSTPNLDEDSAVEEGEEIAGAENESNDTEAIPNEPTDIKENITETEETGNSEDIADVSDVSRNVTITETDVTIDKEIEELNADLEVKSGEINFNFDPFTLTGENNPTKERVEKASDADKERYSNDNLTTAGIKDVDTNGDGYYDLSEKLDFEIKYAIRKTLENLGKNTQEITYKNYILDTNSIDDSTEIEMSDSLKSAVKEVLNISADSEITYGDVKEISTIDLSNKNISDLKGIEYFTNLESLNLSNNQINSAGRSNLKSLLTLKNLKILNLSNNQITTFGQEELANLTSLESLDLSNNQITVLQNINLKETILKSINLQGNSLTTIQNVIIDNLESLNVLLNDVVTIENLYLPNATNFLINTNVLEKFRYVNLDSLPSLDLTIKSNYTTPAIEMVSLKNAYRFYVTPPTARQTSRPNPAPVDGIITEDKTTPYSKFQYIDAPNVTEMNPSFNFATVKYFNLEKYTGEISINTSTSDNTVDISNFNIPLATTFDFITPRQDKTYEQTSYLLENVNANSLATFSNTEKIALSSMRHIYKNLSINSIREITRKGYNSGYAKGFFNISGENLTHLVTNNGEIGDKFNKDEFGVQGCYFPNVLEIVESGMIEQEDKQPEFIYENTNLDSLEETIVSSLGAYGNSIRISTVSNLSVRNIGNIFADREETNLFVEPFTLKGLIAPSAKTLFIANKNNFETLDDIINLPELEEITLLNTGISDISVLQNLDANQIKSLNLKGSKIADIGPIANLGNKLKSIDTTEQRVDYTAYKESDNSVKLVNVINDSSGELIKENSIKITGISNGGIYDATTNSISWENTDNSIDVGNTLTFKFSANYEMNGIEFEYSGTGTVTVKAGDDKPASLQYDVQIVGANNQRVKYSQVDEFNTKLEEGVTLTGKDKDQFNLVVEGRVEKPVGGRKAVSKITYKAVKKDDENIVAGEKVRQIVVSNMDPVLNGINSSVYWKLGDEEIDFAQGITATDEEDGDIDEITITKDFDFKNIKDETKRTGKVTYSVTDSDGNTVTQSTIVYINHKEVKISDDLKVAVNKALGRNIKTKVLKEDLEKVTAINLDNATDLTGLEYLINLESLSISGATVEEGFTLDLNKFPKLKYLYANNVKNLDNNFVKAFNGNNVLEHLEISGENKIEAFTDMNLPNLTRLKVGNISEFDKNSLPKLQHFSLLENNKLRKLNLDSNLNTLEELYLTGYNGSFTINANFISKFKNLKKLGLQNTDITITGINLSNLTSLDLPRMELIENLNLPNLTEFNADFSIVIKFNNNILPNITSFSITAPELVEFSGNDFSNVTSFSHNLPKVEKFNNNKLPKIELLKFSPSFQVLTEFCGNDFRGVKSFNSFSLPYIKKFNGNNFSGFEDGFTWSVVNGAGSLEEFCNNDFSGLLKSKIFQIGDSNGADNYYDLSNLKRIVGNNFGNIGKLNIWSANSTEDVDIYEKEFKDNIFGSGTHTISMSGSFGTLQISSNTLRNLWLNRGTFGVIKDLDLPAVRDFSIRNATIDEMINVNLPNATIFNLGSNKPIIRKMINVNIPKIGNLQLGTADNPMELLQDCTVKWLNTSYIKEIVNLSQTEPNLGLNVHLANIGIERFTIGSATFTNDYGLHNNKIRDIDELAKSVKDNSNAIDANINITVYGQKPEINIYTDEASKVLTFDEIFKASEAATEAVNDLTYTVTRITKGDGTTVETADLPQADTANKQITFNDIDSGTVAEVEVTGNVKIGNRNQSLTNGRNKTVVRITFLGNIEKNPVITGIDGANIEDLTINVSDVDSYTVEKLKEDIEAKVGDTDIKADVKVEILGGSIKKPEAGFEAVTRIKYSVTTSTNKTAEVYRNITVTNYLPTISWTTENLFLHKQVTRITNTTELIDKLKEDITISDFEDTEINNDKDTKLKIYLVKENEKIAIDDNFDLSNLNIGLNTIIYEITDSNGNVGVAERQVRYQDNQYLIGLEDVIINSSQIAEYNDPNNMNGVSLVDPSAYTLTKQVTSDGTTTATIILPTAVEMSEDLSRITGAEYITKYTITETNGASGTQPIVQERKVVVTNYMPKLSFENDTIEYYLGEQLDLTTGVSAIDYEDVDITSRVIMPQIDSTKLTEGNHTVTYTVVDSDGNIVTKERTLKVIGKEIKLEINNDISMKKGEEVNVLDGVTISIGNNFVLDIENNDVLGIKYALTDLSNGSVQEFTTAEQVRTALKTKEDGSYTLKYIVYFKDTNIKTTIEKDREITISSIKILDPNLVKAINRQLGRTNLKSEITLEDLKSLTTLNASGMDISDLTGLELAVNLTNLNLQGNSKLSKADLSKLNKLKTINLSNTGIRDAKNVVLSTSAEIDKLYLSGNDIRELNITLPNVKELDLSNSSILTVENIKASNLTSLKLNNNRITTINLSNISSGLTNLDLSENPKLNLSVSVLNRFNNLKSLNLENTGLKTIENLNLPELTDLRLGKNSIETINGLTVNKLEALDLSGNKLTSISNINVGDLKNLNISSNKLTDVSFISRLKNLQRLDLSNNKIENLSFSGNLNNLISLNAKNNQITEVIGLNSDTLEELYLTGNDDLTTLKDITLNNLKTFEIGNTVKTLDNVVSENLNTSNFIQVTTITDCILPSLDLSGNVSPAKPISKGAKLKTINNSTVKTLPENTTLETIQDVTVMGSAVIDLSKAKIATLDGLIAETTTGLNVAGTLEKIKDVNIKNATNFDLTRATNLKSIENLTMKGSTSFVLADILANSPATKLEIITGLTVSNSTTVNLSGVLKEGAVLKNISLPQATTVDLSNNNINLVEEVSSITAPNLATLNLSNNNIVYIGSLETILGNITNEIPINVNLDNNKIKYISKLSSTGHNLTIASQQVDNLKAIVRDNSEMIVNPAELFKLPAEFDNITITANDGGTVSGTGRDTQITWSGVSERDEKTFSFTATKTTRAGISRYGATVTVTAIGENTPILEMEDGTETIKVVAKDIEKYNLKYGIKYKIGNNLAKDDLPNGYELKIYLQDGNTETEITKLTPPKQGENKTYNLVYKLVPTDGGIPTDTLERKFLTTNGMPTINTLRDITVKKGAVIDLLDGVSATDLEDGNITGKIKVYIDDKLLANPTEYDTKDLDVGKHIVKYEVVDSDGNMKEVNRNVAILSNEKPILTVNPGDLSTKKGSIIDLLDGVSATDPEDGDITEKIKVYVNANLVADPKEYNTKDLSVGTHTVKYEVVDSDKNESSIEKKLEITTSGSGSGGSGGSNGGSGGSSSGGSGGGSNNPTTSTAIVTTNTVSKPTEGSETTNSLIDKINISTIGEVTPFKDVATNHWAKESIDRMSGAGIIKGDGKGNFKPTEKTTRADMTIMLVRLLGLEGELATREFKGEFSDVRKDKYYAKYLELAKEYDLIKGVGENRFNPDANIKREDAMVMVANILKELNIATQEGDTTIEYADKNQISGYAQESVEYLTKLGIIKGSNNLVKPKENLTRAEASQIINNVYNKLIEIQK